MAKKITKAKFNELKKVGSTVGKRFAEQINKSCSENPNSCVGILASDGCDVVFGKKTISEKIKNESCKCQVEKQVPSNNKENLFACYLLKEKSKKV